ncbi:translation initiation factor IF-2 [Gammaproteobacteria bacterium]|nr:translation initiation factor IF-2 [Gammaproteobacteria bacterium]MDB0009923.1 translation initiation factor IF-2 [Gammaproteobacteria bacterium]MDC1043318.1 translation initiation factor IF-2 [Gammaproteobacteria bacterium]
MGLTVKDFAKTLKIKDDALLERMKAAGLSHSKASDEITPADKLAILKSLKERKGSTSSSVTSSSSSGGVTVKSKGTLSQPTSSTPSSSEGLTDNIEAKRQAAAENLKEQQQKREDQIKEAIRLKQEQQQAAKKSPQQKSSPHQKPQSRVNIKDQLSRAAKDYSRRETSFNEATEHQFAKPVEFIKRDIEVPEMIQVGELAKLMFIKGGEVVKVLMSLGVAASINDSIDQETGILVAEELGHNGIALNDSSVEDEIIGNINYSDNPKARAPVITVMGHVDHGKTTLLDFIRKTKVVDGEAGGITQHIGAYQVPVGDSVITFIDTPGHAAFSSMRARGANTTDIVILVVAANDGVMPQTEEAINHAKAAGVSIVVAINKMDLQGADVERIKGDLAAKDLTPEDWGGNIQMVPVSALKGDGVDKLLEAVILESELLELKAHYEGQAQGVVIESELDKFRGAVATLLIQNGTLKVGDMVVCGAAIGKVKSIIGSDGGKLKSAEPSFAVEILGLSSVPNAGETFQVVKNDKEAREIAAFRESKIKDRKVLKQRDESLGNIFESMGQSDKKVLNVILKSDVAGTSEAIVAALADIGNDDASIKVVASGVGGITESDANLALATDSMILGFNVRTDNAAKKVVESEEMVLSYHSIIYELIDEVKARLSGLLDPIIKEEIVGTAEVLEVFNSPKFGQVAGCMVIEGSIFKSKPVRVLRDDVVIHQGELDSLRRFKDDVGEVKSGTECGVGIKNYKDIRPGDKVEVFDRKEEAQSIS